MAEEVFLFLREGLEWTIEASKLLICGLERQASPSVENPQNFAKHIERITCAAPPAAGLKGIVRGGAHDGAAASSGKFIPEHVNAARVGFSGDDDHRGAFFLGESRGDGAHFIRGIQDRGLEDADSVGRHAFVDQNAQIIKIFSDVGDTHSPQRIARLGGARQPDFRRVSRAVKPGRFHGAYGEASTEHGDGLGFFGRVFDDEPAADAENKDDGSEEERTAEREENPARAVWLSGGHDLAVVSHDAAGESYSVPQKWSMRRAQAKLTDW